MALVEVVGNLTVAAGQNTIELAPGGTGSVSNVLTIGSGATPYAYTAANGGSLLVKGVGLGGTASATTVNVKFGGTAPTFTNLIRAEIVGDDGVNQGFVKYDATNGLVVLTNEYGALPTQPVVPNFAAVTTTNNVLVNTAQTFTTGTTVNSLTIKDASLTSAGGNLAGQTWNALGTLNTLTLTSGGIVAQSGSSTISGGAVTTAAATPIYLHTFGDLTIDAYLTNNGAGGVIKAESGTLTFNRAQYFGTTLNIGTGEVRLNSGAANTLMVTPTLTAATLTDVRLNGGSLNLNGQNQAVGAAFGDQRHRWFGRLDYQLDFRHANDEQRHGGDV